jgi:multicomponent Na+:H+ antiporter subunit E
MILRLLGWSLFLLIAADANLAVWPVALVALPLALLVSARLASPPLPRLRLLAALRFVPFFVGQSIRGGLDVALRALRPTPRLDPALLRYRTRLRDGTARVAFADALSLLPGTLCADVAGDELVIHTLDRRTGERPLQMLEEHIAAVFGEEPAA